MNRRELFGLAAAAAMPAAGLKLAGMSPAQLRQRYRDDLFNRLLPFWDKHGIDHQHGGVMHGLDYDGRLVHSTKLTWFQGRAIWVYSFLYNHLDPKPAYLEIARKTKDFLLRNTPREGWWAEAFTREGKVAKPFSGDLYGMYFAAEGLQEYAWAAKDEQSRDLAFSLMKKLHRKMQDRTFQGMGTNAPGQRSQGIHMVTLNTARQMQARWPDPQIAAILEESIEAVMRRHWNPDIGLNNEVLNFDGSRPRDEATKCVPGHSLETLWMIAEEAARRRDDKLWELCAARIRRHIDVGWDHVYGALCGAVNVDAGGYVWPDENPMGTDLHFRFTGEYQYMKPMWALNEILVAALNIIERTGAEWARHYFDESQRLIDEKFSMKPHGQPGYMLFADRRMTYVPRTSRQDNYHPLRQLMLNILTLDRMKG